MAGKGRAKKRMYGSEKNKMVPWSKSDRRKLKQELRELVAETNLNGWEEMEAKMEAEAERRVEIKNQKTVKSRSKKQKHIQEQSHKRTSNKGAKMVLRSRDNRCYICRCEGDKNGKLQYHHVKPVRLGGESTVENGSLLCPKCHKKYHELWDGELDRMEGKDEKEFRGAFERQVGEMRKSG